MEELPEKREYLRTFFGSYASSENGQHLLQGLSRETDSNISTPILCSTYGQAKNPALYKAETRTTSKRTQYKARQVR